WGGSEELWFEMAKYALQQNNQVYHLAYKVGDEHPKITELKSLGLDQYQRPSYQKQNTFFIDYMFSKILFFIKKRTNQSLKKIFKQHPDIVLYNGTCYSIAEEKKLIQKVKQSKCKFFILGHLNNETSSGLTAEKVQIVKDAYTIAEKVFFVSKKSKKIAENHLGIKINNAIIVSNPVNLNDISPLPFPENEVTQMAMVANLTIAHKGHDIVLNILQQPKWQERNWHLNIYGSGIDELFLRTFVQKQGLEQRVTFHGKVNDIRKVWSVNQLLLMPSRMEGMPLALMEAMLCARVALVTDVGGNAECIKHNINGFVAKTSTIKDFEKVMELAFSEKKDWENIGLLAHEYAKQKYNPNPGETLWHLITEN
ncbi:glycosyltransferase, partial [Arachidicoccus sp.]|uniref:glycosyltransferase n=1 Tax=Arachidicoccus sp. TaxID=1872624 RepID=UPI003D254173